MMDVSAIKGVSFGLTSGIITTLGMIVGLDSGTHSKAVVIGGILTIAIADAFSDALGMHISEESAGDNGDIDVWLSTVSTFLSKLFFALTFLIPVIFLELELSVIISVIWGLLVLTSISIWIAKDSHKRPVMVVVEHLLITLVVIVLTHLVGDFVGKSFSA
jgi:VIT1/CCC1 family predicted Fe2+/Mn2+ transporter